MPAEMLQGVEAIRNDDFQEVARRRSLGHDSHGRTQNYDEVHSRSSFQASSNLSFRLALDTTL